MEADKKKKKKKKWKWKNWREKRGREMVTEREREREREREVVSKRTTFCAAVGKVGKRAENQVQCRVNSFTGD